MGRAEPITQQEYDLYDRDDLIQALNVSKARHRARDEQEALQTAILAHPTLAHGAKIVLIAIKNAYDTAIRNGAAVDGRGRIRLYKCTIARATGYDPNSVARIIEKLKKDQLIDAETGSFDAAAREQPTFIAPTFDLETLETLSPGNPQGQNNPRLPTALHSGERYKQNVERQKQVIIAPQNVATALHPGEHLTSNVVTRTPSLPTSIQLKENKEKPPRSRSRSDSDEAIVKEFEKNGAILKSALFSSFDKINQSKPTKEQILQIWHGVKKSGLDHEIVAEIIEAKREMVRSKIANGEIKKGIPYFMKCLHQVFKDLAITDTEDLPEQGATTLHEKSEQPLHDEPKALQSKQTGHGEGGESTTKSAPATLPKSSKLANAEDYAPDGKLYSLTPAAKSEMEQSKSQPLTLVSPSLKAASAEGAKPKPSTQDIPVNSHPLGIIFTKTVERALAQVKKHHPDADNMAYFRRSTKEGIPTEFYYEVAKPFAGRITGVSEETRLDFEKELQTQLFKDADDVAKSRGRGERFEKLYQDSFALANQGIKVLPHPMRRVVEPGSVRSEQSDRAAAD